MSRKAAYTGLILIGVLVAVLISLSFQPGKVDAQKIFAAAQAYTRTLRAQGLPIPSTVNLQELIDKNLLHPDDVSGFAGANVIVSLAIDRNDPQAVLIRARFPDGEEIVTFADGTVKSTR